jgi:hypothetical protein
MKHLVYLTSLVLALNAAAQCSFGITGIGTFEDAYYDSWQYYTNAGGEVGTFSAESDSVHSGSTSLKVDVTTAHSWGMRMFNKCNRPLTNTNFYTVKFWLHGPKDSIVKVALQYNDGGTVVIEEQTVTLTKTGWEEYEVSIQSDVDEPNGKVKFTFPNIGTYYLDDIAVTESAPVTPVGVGPDHANFRYSGVAHNDITSTTATFFRFPIDYATNNSNINNPNFNQLATAKRASASAGISIEFKTSSTSITAKFTEITTYTQGVTQLSFAVYKNGELYNVFTDNDDNVAFTFNDFTGVSNEWRITMPTYGQVQFLGLDIDSNSELEILNPDTRPVYVAIGNSITHGYGQTGLSSHLSFPWQVADSLNYHLYNWGIGGSKVNDIVFDNFAVTGVTPNLVTVLWGYNDFNCSNANCGYDDYILDNTLVYYENLMNDLATTFPTATIMGILPTYSTTAPYSAIQDLDYLSYAQDSILMELQATYDNICFFDGKEVTDASSLSDAVHLNDDGATDLANRIIEELASKIVLADENETYVNSEIEVFPIPVKDALHLDLGETYTQIELSISNLSGIEVFKKTYSNVQLINEHFDQETGTFIVKVNGSDISETIKIVKN